MSHAFVSNLFAFRSPDPEARRRVDRRVRNDRSFTWVGEPGPQWIAGLAPLPPRGPHPVADSLVVAEDSRNALARSGTGRQELLAIVDGAPGRLAGIPGDFTFLRCRPDGSATIARSVGGPVPLYVWTAGDAAAIATCLDYLVRFVDVDFRLNPLVAAALANAWGPFIDDQAPLEGVWLLPRGHAAEVARGTRVIRYWDPPMPASRWTRAERVERTEQLREHIVESLVRSVASDGNLLAFSGGADSSALASLLMGTLGIPLSTLTFLPAPVESLEQELRFIDPLMRRYAHKLQSSWQLRLSDEDRLRMIRAAPRVASVVVNPALHVLPGLARERRLNVLLGGEFVDELLGSIRTFDDWANNTSLSGLVAHPLQIPSGPLRMLHWTRHRVRHLARKPRLFLPPALPAMFAPGLRQQYRDWYADQQRRLALDPHPRAYLCYRFRQGVDVTTAVNWEVTSSLGMARSFPMLQREIVELVFSAPAREAQDRRPKRLVRNALRRDVAPMNLLRTDKGHRVRPPLPWAAWEAPLPAGLESVVAPSWFPEPPARVSVLDALRLEALANMLEALRNCR